MRNCKQCGKFMPNTRIHLGYTKCTRCSDVEKYSAHIVYPHKTGGYVQPVSSSTKKHLQSIDRRSTSGKTAKGNGSWDTWLKAYLKQKEKSNVPREKVYRRVVQNDMISVSAAKEIARKVFKKDGYYAAIDCIDGLFKDEKISILTKSKINNALTWVHSHNRKQQKILMRSL